jgi:hypothetical protein
VSENRGLATGLTQNAIASPTALQVDRLEATHAIPYAPTVIAVAPGHFATIRRTVELLFGIAHSKSYQAVVDAGADPVATHEPGNFGVLMGYDFHLTNAGPRLIEINTNAGGSLLNGFRTAALCDPQQLAAVCSGLLHVDEIQERIVDTFRAEFAAARGPDAVLRTLAIVDERPEGQLLHPEFELFRELFARFGIDSFIGDTAELVRGSTGRVELGGTPIDMVYQRDTDFALATPRTAALRTAYLGGHVVVTPAPREHQLLADKRRLTLFSSPASLANLGVGREDAAFLAQIVPETRLLADLSFDEAWSTRKQWVFKPAAAFGSKAVYRGDKISRRRLEQIYPEPGFVAQRKVAAGAVDIDPGRQRMKFDVRAYAYRDEVLFLGARVYQGQVTNFRSPGGGFSAICVAREVPPIRGEPPRCDACENR